MSLTAFFISLFYAVGFSLASSSDARRSCSLDASHRATRLTGPAGHLAALLKHGRFVPPELAAAAKNPSILVEAYKKQLSPTELAVLNNQSGSVPVTVDPNNGYTAPLIIGDSKLDLLIDTGSSDLWVYSDLLPKNETKGHSLYDTSTGKLLKDYSWKIEYGDLSSAAGIVYQDSVRVGEATATSQAIEVATSISSPNAFGESADGILGLALETLNQIKPKKQPPLWKTLSAVFAVDFKFPSGGTLDFGDLDSSKYNGPITYLSNPYPNYGFWYFTFTEISFHNTTYTPIGYNHTTPVGIIDTGTTVALVSRLAADGYYSNISGAKQVAGQWVFPCSSKVDSLGLKIGGRYFYAYEQYIKQPLGDGICYGGIQGALGDYSKYDSGDIIGTPFIVGNYIVFDGEKNRLGFAHKDLS